MDQSSDQPSSTLKSSALPGVIAGAIVFFAACFVLVLEILGTRLLAPYVGLTLRTYTAIIGVVLTGISIGTWLGGKLADSLSPRRLIAPLLIASGVAVLITVPIIRVIADASSGHSSLRVIGLTFSGLFLPAALLSAVAPTIAKMQLSDLRNAGSVIGRFSALGTAGAIVGTFLTGFYLVGTFRVSHIISTMGMLIVIAGIVIYLTITRNKDKPIPTISAVACLVVPLSAFNASIAIPQQCDVETSYYCLRVGQSSTSPDTKYFFMDDQLHSVVNVANPLDLKSWYTRVIGDISDEMFPPDQPLTTLSVGAGGLAIPRYITATRPGSTNIVLEIDPELPKFNAEHLGLKPGDVTEFRIGDARTSIESVGNGTIDFVVADAFAKEAVPWHLTTREFLQQIKTAMKPNAIMAMNIIDFDQYELVRAELKTMQQTIGNVALVRQTNSTGNFILVASPAPIDTTKLTTAVSGDTTPTTVVSGTELEQLIANSPVLTDDFAPADQLIARNDITN